MSDSRGGKRVIPLDCVGLYASVARVERLETRQFFSAVPVPTSYLINAGGSAYTDHAGRNWSADEYFSGGFASDNVYNVPGTTDDPVYYDRRTGSSFNYNLPIADGTYAVQLIFTDPLYTTAGKRVFNVTADGATELSHFDIIGSGGGIAPLIETFNVALRHRGHRSVRFFAIADSRSNAFADIKRGPLSVCFRRTGEYSGLPYSQTRDRGL